MIPGSTDGLAVGISLLALSAAATDLVRGKIYNWQTVPGLCFGLLASSWAGGWTGLGGALLGIALGFVLYGWMFWLGMMGAGDVKFLMALGAWGGAEYVLKTGVLGVFLGGALAVVLLLFQGKLTAFLGKVYRFLLSLFVRELVLEFPRADRKLSMPFGVPMAAAAIWNLIDDPLKKWGML